MTRLRIRLRAGREDGIALVMAVIVLAIVFVAAGTAIFVTSESQQDASSKKATQSAYTLAQGALSNALAQLTKLYYDDSGQPSQIDPTLHDMAAWSSQVTSGGPVAASSGGTMEWSSRLDCPSPSTNCPGGQTITVSSFELAAWHITATGTMPNPSGTAPRVRTITVDVPVNQEPQKQHAPPILKTVYSGAPQTSDCDMNMDQQVTFTSPVYVVGNLCLKSGGSVVSPTKLNVGGFLYNAGHGDIGKTSAALPELHVKDSCTAKDTTPNTCNPTWDSSKGYYSLAAQNIYATAFDHNPTFPDPPSVDWNWVKQIRGSWDCGNARDLTGNVVLATANNDSYTCTTDSGSLSWNSTTKTMTVDGVVYIDGNLTAQNVDIKYSGVGGIYVGGTINFGTNVRICSADSDFAANFDCSKQAGWDTMSNFLMINGKGAITSNNLTFEGGLYSDANISFSSGQTLMYGPIVTPQKIVPGQQSASGFPGDFMVMSTEPGASTPYWTLGSPQNGTY